jgi:hypothetical protein
MKLILFIFFLITDFANVDLEKRLLLDGKIEMLVPVQFTEMPGDMLVKKYPGKSRPKFVLTDERGTTNIAFSLLENPADSTVLENYLKAIVASYKQNFTTATWVDNGMMRIDGKKAGFLKLITDGADQKIFNFVFLTDLDGKLLVGTFNCVEKDMEEWRPIGEQMVGSIDFK